MTDDKREKCPSCGSTSVEPHTIQGLYVCVSCKEEWAYLSNPAPTEEAKCSGFVSKSDKPKECKNCGLHWCDCKCKPAPMPQEFWIYRFSSVQYTHGAIEMKAYDKPEVAPPEHLIHVIEYSVVQAMQEKVNTFAHTALKFGRERDQLKRELSEAKDRWVRFNSLAELNAEKELYKMVRDERNDWINKYKKIELANKELSRNDHVVFGDLLMERDNLAKELAEAKAEIERLVIMCGAATNALDEARDQNEDMREALEFYGAERFDPHFDRAKWVQKMKGDLGFTAHNALDKTRAAKPLQTEAVQIKSTKKKKKSEED